MIYEIINPSDPITIEADDVLVAKAATLVLGEGAYGLTDEHGTHILGIYLFGATDEAMISEGFYGGLEGIGTFVRSHVEAVAACLESAMVCSIRNRVAIRAAVGDDAGASVRFNEARRSSLNDIAGRARKIAALLREEEAEE